MYFIIEHQTRPDGVVNISETARSSFASALSLYHERYSKLCVTDQFTAAALMLVEEDLTVRLHDVVETLYKPQSADAE